MPDFWGWYYFLFSGKLYEKDWCYRRRGGIRRAAKDYPSAEAGKQPAFRGKCPFIKKRRIPCSEKTSSSETIMNARNAFSIMTAQIFPAFLRKTVRERLPTLTAEGRNPGRSRGHSTIYRFCRQFAEK